ncbi:glycosyltransferase family 1 protein [Bradyrhizobium sp. CB1717]|uniref:glycosyltransferase family 1 protein n=1 Tax=Bradyrhizobium sp. CB1717 TaxID=3039154 RepID=UPI0024B183FD|nr:glycosyltransferase family 1 protein [Bradyrhizobium sp. CB1717]WFU28817.1 glycosyltransferase family 1 protein [Bradyrhizobium sp. CB1717]
MDVAERTRAHPTSSPHGGTDAPLVPADFGAQRRDRMVLNLFFEERDDRWFPGDRHIRPLLRRLVKGESFISGQRRVLLNLCAGLDRLGIRYRVNDYRYIQKHPEELACILGRPFVLDWFKWKNPLLLGVAMYDHPVDAPERLKDLQVKRVLVPCRWYADMFRPHWPHVDAWPVGIDTDLWTPTQVDRKSVDVLLYDKVRWDYERYESELIEPIRRHLEASGRTIEVIRYGHYKEDDYKAALARCRSMIFLCEHESQGIACQQALSSGVPVFAWDRGGPWQDPKYFPQKVRYEGGVSSVPYFDARCGMTFTDAAGFVSTWSEFWSHVSAGDFAPRDYVTENLTLEKGALHYYEIAEAVMQNHA